MSDKTLAPHLNIHRYVSKKGMYYYITHIDRSPVFVKGMGGLLSRRNPDENLVQVSETVWQWYGDYHITDANRTQITLEYQH